MTALILRIVVWALTAALLYDAVVVPVCVAMGVSARRILPQRWWTPVLVAALCSVVLLLAAIPVGGYGPGFWIALGVVWGGALLYLVGDRLPGGRDSVDPDD